jgi:membrane protein
MQFKINDTAKLLRITFKEWNAKDPFRDSAVIAFYAIFSIPGLLLLIINIAGYFFDKEAVNENILLQISSTMGTDTAAQIKEMLINAARSKSSVWGTIIGIIILLVGSTGVFVELQKSLNRVWHVKAVSKKGIVSILKARLFSFGLILAIAFLLMVSLVVSTALAAMGNWIEIDNSQLSIILLNIFHSIFSVAAISVLFALMFKILPDAKIKWKHVWLGAVVTGLLFTLGKAGLAFYFSKAQPASIYGAASSIILILLWVSYSSMILFFGAEFTAAYANMYSGKVPPSDIAETEIIYKSNKQQ